jgi:asparagine synthase (glutamine-hydrolysing)
MTAILALVALDGGAVDRSELERLTTSLRRSDSDTAGVWTDRVAGLGRVVPASSGDTSPRARPATLDEGVWVVADARLDAREDLVRDLGAAFGPDPAGRRDLLRASDDVLLLHAYRAWGERCVEHLLGDFAFAIWDGARRRLFCARDHLGIHPLYFAVAGASLVVSNDLECVRRHPGVSGRLNDLALADYLLFGFNLEADTTAFAAIRAVGPGHTLTLAPGAGPRVERYWELTVPPETTRGSEREHVARFDALLRTAVADRLRGEPAGVLMSGGVDSTRVAAAAVGQLADPASLPAHTIVYDVLMPDEERRFAGLAAQALGIPIEFHPADGYELFAGWDDRAARTPEPSADPLWQVSDDVLRAAGARSRVLLTGYDGDVLCRASLAAHFRGLLRSLRVGGAASEAAWFVRERGAPPPLGVRTGLRSALRRRRAAATLPPWIRPELVARLDLRPRWQDFVAPRRPGGRSARADAVRFLTGPSLREVLRSWHPRYTGRAVAVRHPLLDLRVMGCVLSLPPIPWSVDKAILRRMPEPALPEAILRRPKAGLAADPVAVRVGHGLVAPTRSRPAPWEDYVDAARLPSLAAVRDTDQLWPRVWATGLEHWLGGL